MQQFLVNVDKIVYLFHSNSAGEAKNMGILYLSKSLTIGKIYQVRLKAEIFKDLSVSGRSKLGPFRVYAPELHTRVRETLGGN